MRCKMRTLLTRTAIVLVAIVFAFVLAQSRAFGIDYVVTDLGTLGGTKSEAHGINNNDEVVGLSYVPYLTGDFVFHAFLYSQDVMTDLGVATCTDQYGKSVARGINDSGQIVGRSCFWVPGNFDRPFLYSQGVMNDLGTLGGSAGEAWDINNLGHVVGDAAITGDVARHAFLAKEMDGIMTMIDLGTLGGSWSTAYGINDSDQVVGASRYSSAAIEHAFLYQDGVMTDLTPNTGSSKAYDLNNSGQIVGTAGNPPVHDSHAFLYNEGVITTLGVLSPGFGAYGTGISEAYGINNYGQIVGWSYASSGIPHAFIYENDVMTDLNDLIAPDSEWILNYALDINDRGRIAGIGTINGQTHAFLMVPKIPEISLSPATLDFGPVAWGSSLTREIVIGNSGIADLIITGISLCEGTSAEFSWPAITFPLTVAPGSSETFSITYTPVDTVADTGCVSIAINDPYNPIATLVLTGTGALLPVIKLIPPTLEFGTVMMGSNRWLVFDIQNLGHTHLTINSIERCVGTSSEFSWLSPPVFPFSLTRLEGRGIPVIYTPADVGSDTGCLRISSNDPANPVATLNLTAEGIPSPVPLLDLDIESFSATPSKVSFSMQHSILGASKEVKFKLVVKNAGEIDGTAQATLVGMRSGSFRVYNESITVSAPVGKKSTYAFPSYDVSSSDRPGITWTVTIHDRDPDADVAWGATAVKVGAGVGPF